MEYCFVECGNKQNVDQHRIEHTLGIRIKEIRQEVSHDSDGEAVQGGSKGDRAVQNRIKDIFPTNFAFCFSVSCSGKVKVSGNP